MVVSGMEKNITLKTAWVIVHILPSFYTHPTFRCFNVSELSINLKEMMGIEIKSIMGVDFDAPLQ